MTKPKMLSHKVQEIHFTNKINQAGQIKLEQGFTFKVNFAPDGTRCVANLYQSLKDKEHPEVFFLSVDMLGIFSCEGAQDDDVKKQLHTMCYNQLFPFMQTKVQDLCAESGLPGVVINKIDIDASKVQMGSTKKDAEEKPADLKGPMAPIV